MISSEVSREMLKVTRVSVGYIIVMINGGEGAGPVVAIHRTTMIIIILYCTNNDNNNDSISGGWRDEVRSWI